MLELTPPTRIPMFPSNYREFLLTPAVPAIPAPLQTLSPGSIFRLAQPSWPVDSVMPSFYALSATTIFAAFFLVAFKDLGALVNYEFRKRLGIAGHPVMGMVLSLLAFTMLLITYENDIKKRSGYYQEGSDPRYVVWLSATATVCAILWASSTFQTPVAAADEAVTNEGEGKKEELAKGSRRQQKKQAKREAKKIGAKKE
ncbi:Mitochondrial inner membrane protease [Pseudozyma hubeiensis]|nr:Mitochondrial inner membrane protease [Pseudozyma hubeiensis]